MGALKHYHRLEWRMYLGDRGCTCFELTDIHDVRWGWIINAAGLDNGWTAHVGDFGQARDIGCDSPPVEDQCEHILELDQAKLWVEETIARAWMKRR